MGFKQFFRAATGRDPYPWQERVAAEGLPEAIDVETGAGKTAGVVLGWLYRVLHPDGTNGSSRPWLVYALPMRSLVDQTARSIELWLERLGLCDVRCFRLLGGGGPIDAGWRDRPGQPTIIVGTVDMLLSRALMRGYATSRWRWPLEFGLLHSGCHWVFDEVQLLGPALATSRQLQAFRRQLGVASPCSSTWMSATLDVDRLATVDNPVVHEPLVLGAADREGPLAKRLQATRTIEESRSSEPRALAAAVLEAHRPGTLTLVIVNDVRRCREVFTQIRRRADAADSPEVHVLHGRFRPADRAQIVDRAITAPIDPAGAGRVLVATQVVEAGLDISAAVLVTDAAPWSSIVQRAGRCNRQGEFGSARLLWTAPQRALPYRSADIEATIATLRGLEGKSVTSTELSQLGGLVNETHEVVPVLRRRDLIELFDTSPDLVGNDIDVGRFIRSDDDLDVHVGWRDAAPDGDGGQRPFAGGPIRSDELCRVGVGEARRWLRSLAPARAWVPDHLRTRGTWRRAALADLRPGTVVVVDTRHGGYDPMTGWDGTTRRPVPVVSPADESVLEVAPVDEGSADDPATFTGAWVGLGDHLSDTALEAKSLVSEVNAEGLTDAHLAAVVRAAALHDLGKIHEVFQCTLVDSAPPESRTAVENLRPLAKSASGGRRRHSRPHFRHELVSALLVGEHVDLLMPDEAVDPDLVRYLVAAHHGRVRLAIRSIPGEVPPDADAGRRVALGVMEGDVVGPVTVGDVHIPETTLSLAAMDLGGPDSWTARALALRDREDLGPFRLATLEALVCIADWRASRCPSTVHEIGSEGRPG